MEKEEPDGEIQTAVPGSGNDNHNLELLFLIVKVTRNIPKTYVDVFILMLSRNIIYSETYSHVTKYHKNN